jgi:long-subunit acyl-CoA synthetase (AMP-forming)
MTAGGEVEQLSQQIEARLAGVSPDDGALIIYTSGTTGNPKGARDNSAGKVVVTAVY